MDQASPELLTSLLKQVSRSFYLTLRVLPGSIRPQIGTAYLLARASDTIADTELVPLAMRLSALDALQERIMGHGIGALDVQAIARAQPLPATARPPEESNAAEQVLLDRIESILLLLEQFSSADLERLREVLRTILSGQRSDLERFALAEAGNIVALQTAQELDDYTYRVAGCVGEFWTRICRAHLFPKARLDEADLLAKGVRFGKGLQLVNILRDLPKDLRQGRCYLPAKELMGTSLSPQALLEPANEPAFRPLYNKYLAHAGTYLADGWAYTNLLPRRCVRVRLACAWPLLIGVRTLNRLGAGNVLDHSNRIKIDRAEVRSLIARSIVAYPWPKAWNRLFCEPGV